MSFTTAGKENNRKILQIDDMKETGSLKGWSETQVRNWFTVNLWINAVHLKCSMISSGRASNSLASKVAVLDRIKKHNWISIAKHLKKVRPEQQQECKQKFI